MPYSGDFPLSLKNPEESMDDLIAKNVFGELTLGDVWGVVNDKVKAIAIRLPDGSAGFGFHVFSHTDSDLELFDSEAPNNPPWRLPLDGKVVVKFIGEYSTIVLGEDFRTIWGRWRGVSCIHVRLFFHGSHRPADLSCFLPSPEKLPS